MTQQLHHQLLSPQLLNDTVTCIVIGRVKFSLCGKSGDIEEGMVVAYFKMLLYTWLKKLGILWKSLKIQAVLWYCENFPESVNCKNKWNFNFNVTCKLTVCLLSSGGHIRQYQNLQHSVLEGLCLFPGGESGSAEARNSSHSIWVHFLSRILRIYVQDSTPGGQTSLLLHIHQMNCNILSINLLLKDVWYFWLSKMKSKPV